MNSQKISFPKASQDFSTLKKLLTSKSPFSFIRFSDGEMEIIRNERLEINDTQVIWRHGVIDHAYPAFDAKLFDPMIHQEFRSALLASARHHGVGYYKGIPTAHNNLLDDRDLMVELNGGLDEGITFSDLFLNCNYKKFFREILPLFHEFKDVVVVGNFRMAPQNENSNWALVDIPDNFFLSYRQVYEEVCSAIRQLPEGALVLSSASSLSNVIGMFVNVNRPDITFIDIGTSLHGQMGMQTGIRAYHVHAEPWRFGNVVKKVRFRVKSDYRIRW